ESCGVQFDRFQKFSDQPLTRCPECGKKSLRKVYSPVGIVFKGSGFYSTDNRSPSGSGSAGASRSSEAEKAAAEKSSTPTTTANSTPAASSTSEKK
ncbi:MAG TPA: zinc ribbon domain-containing protein, partial [Anaerolineaceae bacterium]|nr:zinc ribbon domain-containing protein [Anaerolineaceae bacterium]